MCLDEVNGLLRIKIYLQPKASKNQIIGLHNQELKVAITAPPVDGEANKALIAFFAKLLSVPKSDLVLQKGQQSRHKIIEYQGDHLELVKELIKKWIGN